ncbi:phosphotransferase [Pseudobacteriovorax antillogorgiicola]|uniref:hydroxymethylglutaryl-CoA reductase (NADPH) n=1 Tax=Pseudobacteriovorax antillogorgiicola TaxID=1513793 RepID=A0A1Y6CMG5_9BACT|nr:phosphotransferase [Pseudobacteriovorax antillogorgiicola]TCS45421.1 3-hydroxy-3-methylglutaryl-coenzyme A reductase [Pseudobacteriovorax antillogorgiicola]SMF74129.1 3-hydroxy-3-methylglutaryl-coenzyme A reductase [Pseudobacteriovorax antillogorgiicola]
MKKSRTESRLFYHRGRRPRVLFALGSRILTGELADWSRIGLGVFVPFEDERSLDYDPIVPKLYVHKTDDDYCIHGLEVVYIEYDNITSRLRLGFQAKHEEALKSLHDVMLRITEQGSAKSQEHKLFQPDRLPSSSRANPFKQEAIQERHDWLEEKWNDRFPHLRDNHLNPEDLAGNIENYIGAVQIPVGIAGPVHVKGLYTHAHIPVPIATTEGALVSSITRGARACALAGGIRTHVIHQTMLRAPSFHFRHMQASVGFAHWLDGNREAVIAQAESVSSVAKVSDIQHFIFGDTVHVKFFYTTGDAAGQNMTTACTFMACEWIAQQISKLSTMGFIKYNIEGNLSGDKKVNHQNFIQGRGIAAVAECLIPEDILKKVLKVELHDMIEGWMAANVGARQIGMVGANINFANVVGGIFAATGQDIASVHESSIGILNMKEKDQALYICAYLPSLVIGTVGGGTALPTQQECLKMMDCAGTDRAFRMAEIIAATCLALDLSTGAAIAAGQFVSAHEKLGRNRPKAYFKLSEVSAEFFNSVLPLPNDVITHCEQVEFSNNSGATASLMSEKRQGSKGLFKFRLNTQSGEEVPVVIKLKSPDNELVELGLNLIRLSGEDRLPGLFELHYRIFGFEHSHLREIEIFQGLHQDIRQYLPKTLGCISMPERELYAIAMEDMSSFELLNSVNEMNSWTEDHIQACLKAMAHIHSKHLNQPDSLPPGHIEHFDASHIIDGRTFLDELTRYVGQRYPDIMGDLSQHMRASLERIHIFGRIMQSYHQTLTHGDFNPRNLCFRRSEGELNLCLFDWELAQFHNPQRDLIEFLGFVISPDRPIEDWQSYVDDYCRYLESYIQFDLDRPKFAELMYYNGLVFALTRLNLYCLAHNIARFPFLERLCQSVSRFILENPQRKDWS